MTAFKCDICGAYYEPYNYYGNQKEANPNTVVLCRKSAGVIANSINQTFDVCPKCMKAFEKLLEERKRHGPSIGGD